MTSNTVDLAVVVVTHNQHDLLRQCLRSALTALEGMKGEIIVVDNASVDATPRVMASEFPLVRAIRNETNLHYTRAVNQGMRATNGRYVCLLNDDTEVKPDCFGNAVDFMDGQPRCGALGPMLVSPGGDVQISAQKFPTPFREVMAVTGMAWRLRHRRWGANMQREYPMPMGTQVVDWVCGGAIFLRRSVMVSLGYHDEGYLFYRDDPDIGMRMRSAGWEVWYFPGSCVVHHHGASTVKTDSKVRFDLIAVRSRRHYHRKFHGTLAAGVVEGFIGLCTVLRGLKALLLGRFQLAMGHWRELILMFEALVSPREEREAIAGYRHALYNGMVLPEEDVVGAGWGGAVRRKVD